MGQRDVVRGASGAVSVGFADGGGSETDEGCFDFRVVAATGGLDGRCVLGTERPGWASGGAMDVAGDLLLGRYRPRRRGSGGADRGQAGVGGLHRVRRPEAVAYQETGHREDHRRRGRSAHDRQPLAPLPDPAAAFDHVGGLQPHRRRVTGRAGQDHADVVFGVHVRHLPSVGALNVSAV